MMPKSFEDPKSGTLVVNTIPANHTAFPVRRVFMITGKKHRLRGDHAHKTCWQLLMIISGSWQIQLETLKGSTFQDTNPPQMEMFIIEPGTWTKLIPLSDDAQILVMCDKDYDEADYVRDYEEYKKMQLPELTEPIKAQFKTHYYHPEQETPNP